MWVDLGQRVPEPHEVDARCKDCFPADRLETRRREAEEEASESSGGGASDSSEMGSEEEDIEGEAEAGTEAGLPQVLGPEA